MSPTGVYSRGGAKKSGGGDASPSDAPRREDADVKHSLALPPAIDTRVARAAKADDRTIPTFLRRFIITNIDIIDPDGAE